MARRNEGPTPVATHSPPPYPPHKANKVRAQRRPGLPRTRSPRAPAPEEGLGRRSRGRAGNLPHPGSIRAPLLSRPVAPQSASYLDGVASPPAPGDLCGRAAGGAGGSAGRGRGAALRAEPAGAGPEPRGQTRPGRASAGARGCECAMRARRGECVCVCPRFPLPSPPVLRPDGAASVSRKALAAAALGCPARPQRGALGAAGTGGRAAAAPQGSGAGPGAVCA